MREKKRRKFQVNFEKLTIFSSATSLYGAFEVFFLNLFFRSLSSFFPLPRPLPSTYYSFFHPSYQLIWDRITISTFFFFPCFSLLFVFYSCTNSSDYDLLSLPKVILFSLFFLFRETSMKIFQNKLIMMSSEFCI